MRSFSSHGNNPKLSTIIEQKIININRNRKSQNLDPLTELTLHTSPTQRMTSFVHLLNYPWLTITRIDSVNTWFNLKPHINSIFFLSLAPTFLLTRLFCHCLRFDLRLLRFKTRLERLNINATLLIFKLLKIM